MKNSKIVAAYENLAAVIGKQEKYPVKLSYAMTRNFKALESLMKDFETERNKLLDLYNVKGEGGEPAYKSTGKIKIVEEHESDWIKEMSELLEIDVEFSPHMVAVEDFPENIEPSILYGLDFMIKE